MKRLVFAPLFALMFACNGGAPAKGSNDVNPLPPTADPLAERPELGPPKPYQAPVPQVYKTPQGITVWLLERHELPMVSVALAVPSGSADDPLGKEGLAHITATMLDEGAGDRDALAISTAITDLGADLWIDTARDGSRVGLTVLKKHLEPAFGVFADVVARPRFDPAEFKRVSALWHNQLKQRNDNPQAVAQVVSTSVLYGSDTPYGHPTSGQLESAKTITLPELVSFYKKKWRPDQAKLVVAGDITRAELDALLAQHLGDWKAPAEPPPPRAESSKPLESRPRLVLVDRPEAPQAVVSYIGPGVAAGDPDAAQLELINTALGGSFTSRLNQNLREDRGWTYGASSSFVELRGVGPFIARSAVFANVTGPAIQEILSEIRKMAEAGLGSEELAKVRAKDLTDLIQTHERLDGLTGRMSTLAMLGLPYDHDAKASVARQQATPEQLTSLAREHLDAGKASIVVVGPKEHVLPQLLALDLGEPELWSPEGRPVR